MKFALTYALNEKTSRADLNTVKAHAKTVKALAPDWDIVVYAPVGLDLPGVVDAGAVVVRQPAGLPGHDHLFWRFLPMLGDEYAAFAPRDIGAALTPRDVEAYRAWLAGDKHYLIIRDHPSHYTREEIVAAGRFACRINDETSELYVHLQNWMIRNRPNSFQSCSEFLRSMLFLFKANGCANILSTCHEPRDATQTPFPATAPGRTDTCYVGMPVAAVDFGIADELFCAVVCPRHYKKRWKLFQAEIKKSKIVNDAGLLRIAGPTAEDDVAPQWFKERRASDGRVIKRKDASENYRAHYYFATLSHIDALRKFLLSSRPVAMIFEDDISLTSDFDDVITRCWGRWPEGWWCSYVQNHTPQTIGEPFNEFFSRVKPAVGTQCYMVSREGAEILYSEMTYRPYVVVDQLYRVLAGQHPDRFSLVTDRRATTHNKAVTSAMQCGDGN